MLTEQEKIKCNKNIDIIQKALYSKFLPIGNVQDLLKMIVDTEDIKQSIEDFVNSEDLAWTKKEKY